MTKPISYADAGVSIDNANLALDKIKNYAKSTFNEKTLTEIGSFGGMFSAMFPEMKEPILVASADGVGTKLKIAFETGIHNTIGQDLVNHCVNDILAQGARPLFFLDYFATGKLSPDVTTSVVEGISIACKANGCVLLGGETAEMPGFYADGEYDLAGFIVGVVDKSKVIDGKNIKAGDVVLGLPSSGLQTNGYSLARKLFFEVGGFSVDSQLEELGETVGEALLKPHASFLKPLDKLLDSGKIKGLAHITGGGLLENIPRILPADVSVEIHRGTWTELPVFGLMQNLGNVETSEMFRAFNMGVGMVVVCAAADKEFLKNGLGECFEIGRVVEGKNRSKLNEMAKLSHSVSAELRLFAFYLSNGSLSSFFEDILSDDFDYDRLLCEPSLLEQVFAIFANTLEIDEEGKVLNAHHVHKRVAQFIRSEFDQGYVVEPPFESWEVELHI